MDYKYKERMINAVDGRTSCRKRFTIINQEHMHTLIPKRVALAIQARSVLLIVESMMKIVGASGTAS